MSESLGDYIARNVAAVLDEPEVTGGFSIGYRPGAFVDLDRPPAPPTPEDPDVAWHRRLHDLAHPIQRNTINMLISREQALDYGIVTPTEEERAEREARLRAWRRPDRRARRWAREQVRRARCRVASAVAGFDVERDVD